ncbi:MAG TPA: lipid A deacylase LpxR family protein [Thermoanaerobaculia bacterium]|nr:lipid A deacylase LpxR family protein [Thermoanaerobaculia bacterium]
MRSLTAALATLLLLAPAALADSPIAGGSLFWENDAFAAFSSEGDKSDDKYTNGVRFTFNIDPERYRIDGFMDRFCRGFCAEGDPDCTRNFCRGIDPRSSVALVAGHNFYTPEDIENPNPQPLDRPWAGWLYVGALGVITDANEKRQDTFEVQAGILGQGAGAGRLQTAIHKLGFSKRIPAGWSNQLENEPALNLLYDQSRRYGNANLDIVPQAGVVLGTIQTYVHGAATVRVGWNITGFPVALIIPSVTSLEQEKPRWEAYVFAGGDARLVAHNAFLDGGLFRDGPSVDNRDFFVHDIRAGLSVRYKRFRLTYSHIRRSEEFEPVLASSGVHEFGSFMIGIEPPPRKPIGEQ